MEGGSHDKMQHHLVLYIYIYIYIFCVLVIRRFTEPLRILRASFMPLWVTSLPGPLVSSVLADSLFRPMDSCPIVTMHETTQFSTTVRPQEWFWFPSDFLLFLCILWYSDIAWKRRSSYEWTNRQTKPISPSVCLCAFQSTTAHLLAMWPVR